MDENVNTPLFPVGGAFQVVSVFFTLCCSYGHVDLEETL